METVKVGQVWQSNDPREAPGRLVRVWSVDDRYAHVRSQDTQGGWTGRSRILLGAFRTEPGKAGYRLVQDAEG